MSSAVDVSNADILLLQNETLKVETGKMKLLKIRIDDYWDKHSAQTSLFYASLVIIILLFGVGFLLLRAYWQHSKHQKVLMSQNRLLAEERDKQKTLNEQLQDATQSKLSFFTNVSHDLRTPLTLIAEPVSQLVGADNLTPHQHTLVKIADKNVRILLRLINQILDFRKYENGKLNLNLTEIDFRQIIKDWMEAFYAVARKRDIKLSLVEPASDSPLPLAIDVEKIERVFFNILSNSFKYTPDNGSITVSYDYNEHNVTFKVSDTGEGIDERELDNIFDRFYQVDRINPKGSGIGLFLSKAFVELHGGTISVESSLGKGSVFAVTLPVVHNSRSIVVPEKSTDRQDVWAELDIVNTSITFDETKPLVLIIDDNKDIQKLVGELLNADYNIITASNGRAGLRMAAKYVPDLIICDVMMPVMDGMECCRCLKNEITTSHIPVLMLTACNMDEQRVQGYDSGADGYLSKPFKSEVLKSRCSSLIINRKRIKKLWQSPSDATCRKKDVVASLSFVTVSDIDNEFYNRFLKIFREEMGNPDINVDWIASKMGLERSQFYRKIKSLTNYAPVELMRNLRLKQGRILVMTTEKNVSEIAYETGFSTPAYFTKCYRDAFGETPSESRNNLK